MTLRPIALLAVLLLAACSSDKPKPAPTPQASRSVTMVEPVLPAHLRELSGTLSSIQGSLPRGSEVQMALLVIDERDRPQRLLASETVLATGELMPFRLPFNPESFPPAGGALRVELHARVIQSGQLAWRLHPLRIAQPTTQSLGLDPLALAASRANAELNGVELSYSADFFAEDDRFDLILVADVLYDRANLPLLDQFLSRGRQALVADSRVRDFRHPLYRRLDVLDACTWPDLAEPAEFRLVSLYHAERGQA
ncbi:hypothetical protein ACU7A6_08405 [Pseudomonas aeruginosa]